MCVLSGACEYNVAWRQLWYLSYKTFADKITCFVLNILHIYTYLGLWIAKTNSSAHQNGAVNAAFSTWQ